MTRNLLTPSMCTRAVILGLWDRFDRMSRAPRVVTDRGEANLKVWLRLPLWLSIDDWENAAASSLDFLAEQVRGGRWALGVPVLEFAAVTERFRGLSVAARWDEPSEQLELGLYVVRPQPLLTNYAAGKMAARAKEERARHLPQLMVVRAPNAYR